MDCAGDELGRIVAFVNRRPWIMEEQFCGGSEQLLTKQPINNYFFDKLGVTEFGDTSIHRVCGWHASPEQFEAFLNHMEGHSQIMRRDDAVDMAPEDESFSYRNMPPPPKLDQINHKGVTALHVAVYRNSFHAISIVQQLLRKRKDLASMPMVCGTYPLHVLCAHNVTIRKDVLQELLEADPSVVWKEDRNGDTPLSLLWKNVLRFRWAQQEHIVIDEEEENMDNDDENGSRTRRQRSRPSWMTVISPEQYMEYSLMLIRAALKKEELSLVDICQMPRCPPLLIQLFLQYCCNNKASSFLKISSDLLATDDMLMSPLHHAARVKPVTAYFVPPIVLEHMRSVVDLLLAEFPSMALKPNKNGRLALHYMLEKGRNGRATDTLFRFVEANPDSLGIQDPITGLYAFALLAKAIQQQDDPGDPMEIDDDLTVGVDREHLGSIFTLLRHLPEAAIYSR